jgi:hypothetical protein
MQPSPLDGKRCAAEGECSTSPWSKPQTSTSEILLSRWYVIVNAAGRYLPLRGAHWVGDVRAAQVYTSLGHAKAALRAHPAGCRIERLPRLPDRISRA